MYIEPESGDQADRPDKPSVVECSLLQPGVALVRPCSTLTDGTVPQLRRVVDVQLDTAPWAVLLDLTTVTALPPAAVAVLVEVAERAGPVDVGLYLIATNAAVAQALQQAETLDLFDIHPTVESALRALESTG